MKSQASAYGSVATATHPRSLNLKYFNLGLFSLIIGLGVFYLISISNLAVLGFVLKDLKSEVSILASEQLAKEEEINRIRSYQVLANRTKNLNMVAIGEVEYLQALPEVVARK